MFAFPSLTTTLAVIFLSLTVSNASAQLKTPSTSPPSTLIQTVGLTEIKVVYSRPSVKGRAIFGKLEPYGQVWRTGANASTKISFSDSVFLSGKAVAAGTYALYTVPGPKEWIIILNKNTQLWGAGGYNPGEDVLRFNVLVHRLPRTVETFIISVTSIEKDAAIIEMAWEKTLIKFKLNVDYDRKVMAEIRTQLADSSTRTAENLYQAATYYYEHHKDPKAALNWIAEAIEISPHAFWMLHLKAKLLAELKQYAQAIIAAEQSLAVAKKAPADYGYINLNKITIAAWKKLNRAEQ